MTTSLTKDETVRAGGSFSQLPDGVELARVRPSNNKLALGIAGGALVLGLALRFTGMHLALAACIAYLGYLAVVYLAYALTSGTRVAVDQLMRGLVYGAFTLAVIPLISVVWTVVANGLPTALNPDFLTQTMNGVTGLHDRATTEEGAPMVGGAYHAIIGTLIITGIATLISVPIGMFTAIYLVEYGAKSRLAHLIRFMVDVMTGIPSIVAGLFAFALFVVLVGIIDARMGFAGAVALCVLMIPTVVRNSEEMLRIVPNELREAALALGVPKWRTIAKVVLPTAASGLASGVTLAIARVIGETAPLLVAVGFARGLNLNAFEGPMSSLAVYTYAMFTRPLNPGFRDPSIERAWASALLLVVIVILLNLLARAIANWFAPKTGR